MSANGSSGSGSGNVCVEAEDGPSLLLLLPLLLSLVWVLLDLFYSSSLLGWLVTRLSTFLLTDSGIHLGKSGWEGLVVVLQQRI